MHEVSMGGNDVPIWARIRLRHQRSRNDPAKTRFRWPAIFTGAESQENLGGESKSYFAHVPLTSQTQMRENRFND